jgi:hypothetical protein
MTQIAQMKKKEDAFARTMYLLRNTTNSFLVVTLRRRRTMFW